MHVNNFAIFVTYLTCLPCLHSLMQTRLGTNSSLFFTEYQLSSSASEILRGHPDYEAKLDEYLTPVQVNGKQWNLCYRASEHQYSATAFHAACDNKGPTVTLVRVGIYVFGGYTDKSWGLAVNDWISSTAAFLFSLKNDLNQQYKMLSHESGYTMYNGINGGPAFGRGHDLYIAPNCNANTASYSKLGQTYSAPNGYAYESSEAQNFLAGSKNFRCDEYEVFYQV